MTTRANLVQLTLERPYPLGSGAWPLADPTARLRSAGFRFDDDGALTGSHEQVTDAATGGVTYRQWDEAVDVEG